MTANIVIADPGIDSRVKTDNWGHTLHGAATRKAYLRKQHIEAEMGECEVKCVGGL